MAAATSRSAQGRASEIVQQRQRHPVRTADRLALPPWCLPGRDPNGSRGRVSVRVGHTARSYQRHSLQLGDQPVDLLVRSLVRQAGLVAQAAELLLSP